jgi:hypothetical protein
MRRVWVPGVTLGLALLGSATAARAADITDVASSFDDDNPFDLRLRVGYVHEWKSASIKRESEGAAGQTDIAIFKDLLYAHQRDSMNFRAEIGIFQDLMIYGELPVVLNDSREYRYDQSLGSGCVYPGGSGMVNCVDARNSSTIADGILPMNGYDGPNSTNGMVGFAPGSDLVFRGVSRGGGGLNALDTVNLGITWGPLSQRRDDTKPNWIVNLEGDISIGNVMKFDRMKPDANHGVSDGLHRLIARTSISKRFKYVEPYMGFWYNFPIARDDSLFVNYGPTMKNGDPQQSAGTVFGLEGVPWERPASNYKIAIDVRGRIEGKFDGRGYSEAWEIFASSPALSCDPMATPGNPACDPKMINNLYNMNPAYTGLTTIENYATLGADAAITVQAGKYIHFNVGVQYNRDQAHFITIDDVGKAFDQSQGDGCSVPIASRVSRPCEFNPAFRPVFNEIGRRYRVDNVDMFKVGIWAQAMF